MKKVFITGIAGFIGFHLASALRKKGHQVFGIDNYNDYYSIELKKDRTQILQDLGCTVIKSDLLDKEKLLKLIFDFNPSHIVHLAAQAGVRYSLKNPEAYIQSNLIGFANLLDILKESPKTPFLYASSSSVYGDNAKVPFCEQDKTDKPKNLYGATKKANELMAYAYHSLYGQKMQGYRFFTVYGPWGRPDMAYYSFSKAILEGKPINVYEGASIQRDFTYVDDIVQGLLKGLDVDVSFEVFNLGNHQPVLLNDFIDILENCLGKKAIKNYLPQAKGDMPVTYADISKSQKILGYFPETNLEEGLMHFSNWFVDYYEKKQKQLLSQSR